MPLFRRPFSESDADKLYVRPSSGVAGSYIEGPMALLGNFIPAEGIIFALPVVAPGPSFDYDRISAHVITAGTAGAVVRLGIYEDDGAGGPLALVVDAGTIDGTSNTFQEITIAETLTGGRYWLAAVVQGAAGTRPNMAGTTTTTSTDYVPVPGVTLASARKYIVSSGTHAAGLPDPFPAYVRGGSSNTAVRVVLRRS